MANSADYGVTEVKYNSIGKYIEWVKVGKFNSGSFGIRENWLRTKVISELENGKTFITVIKHGDKLRKGPEIHIINLDGKKYIRTDNDSVASDNLDDLPEF
jgi:hypothetical protein